MKSEDLIKEFVKKIITEKASFSIVIDGFGTKDECYHFVQSKVGSARYVYGSHTWGNENCFSSLVMGLKQHMLVAIVREEKIYLFSKDFFHIWNNDTEYAVLPTNACYFIDAVKAENERLYREVFLDFYNSLDTTEMLNEEKLVRLKKDARNVILGKDVSIVPEYIHFFNEQVVADMLCGFVDTNQALKKKLEDEVTYWTLIKMEHKKIEEYVEKKEIVENWEVDMANAINGTNASTLNVEFSYNGKNAVSKLRPFLLLKNLIYQHSFEPQDFYSESFGTKLLNKLGVAWPNEESLDCSCITQISYGDTVLYTKPEK